MNGKIKFFGNPWPEGHALKEFYLGVLLHEAKGDLPAKATLDLRFRTEDYYYPYSYDAMLESSKDQSSLSSRWERIDTWLNYGSAYVNSIASHDALILGDENEGFDLDCLDDFNRVVDPIMQFVSADDNYQIPAFQSHILSRDDMADHHVSISRDPSSGLYNIIWRGKCDKVDNRSYRYLHEFELQASDIPFGGYSGHKLAWHEQATLLPEVRDLELRSLLDSVLINPGKVQFKIGHYSSRDRLLPN